jgi:hypothetical protein
MIRVLQAGRLFKFERRNLYRGGDDKEHYRLEGCSSSKEETCTAAEMIRALQVGRLFKFEKRNLYRGGHSKEHYRLEGFSSSKEETFLAADMIRALQVGQSLPQGRESVVAADEKPPYNKGFGNTVAEGTSISALGTRLSSSSFSSLQPRRV